MTAYYNEHDPFAAQWLRNLIRDGHIAPGVVDERSIEDVRPSDLGGFVQCHFFAGIGVWSSALRGAGWPDDRPVWTASCPCQPFSAAGARDGFDDERHLWPALYHLVEQCRPPVVIGEQVASGDANAWCDLVQVDLEALDYAFGAVPFPASSVGAPHIRDRLYWVASDGMGDTEIGVSKRRPTEALRPQGASGDHSDDHRSGYASGGVDRLAHPIEGERGRWSEHGSLLDNGSQGRRHEVTGDSERSGANFGLAHHHTGLERRSAVRQRADERAVGAHGVAYNGAALFDQTHGFWRHSDWIYCRDGKWRQVESNTEPLAHGLARGMGTLSPRLAGLASVAGLDAASLKRAKAYRVGSLRGYGNAIVRPQAIEFIRAYMDACKD